MKQCAYDRCQAPINQDEGRGRPRKYCDRKCAKRAENLRAKLRGTTRTDTCTENDCDRIVYATGLCRPHYVRVHRKRNKTVPRACDICGLVTLKESRTQRYAGSYCSTKCRDDAIRKVWPSTQIPEDHWARWYGKTSPWTPPVVKPAFRSGKCHECDALICEPAAQVPSIYCSDKCTARVHRRRRRAREHEAPGEFTFTQVMRQYIKQGAVCAYCQQPATGLPDPEHVLPLSRGGRNDMSNIVAACRTCNTDKGDLTLTEWQADRERRGLPQVDTTLHGPAYLHVQHMTPTQPAWRDRVNTCSIAA